MDNYSFFPRRYRRAFQMAVIALSMCLMASSVNHVHYNSFAGYGLVGEGHPVDFLCDYSDGAIHLASQRFRLQEHHIAESNPSRPMLPVPQFQLRYIARRQPESMKREQEVDRVRGATKR
jgi:hypothetical protein